MVVREDREAPLAHGDGTWWYADFDIRRSVERCRLYQKRSTEASLWCGLELMRAKIILKRKSEGSPVSDAGHRRDPVGAFLKAVGISRATASRRESLAKQFMAWADIADIGRYEMPEMRHVVAAMDLLASECFSVQHFTDYLARHIDPQEYLVSESGGDFLSSGGKSVFGRSLKPVFTLIRAMDHQINETDQSLRWTTEQRQEARDTLVILRDQFSRLVADLEAARTWEGARKRVLKR